MARYSPAQARKNQVFKAIVLTAPLQVKLLIVTVGSTAETAKNVPQAKISANIGVVIASAMSRLRVVERNSVRSMRWIRKQKNRPRIVVASRMKNISTTRGLPA